jgi:hypothetical protein
MTGWRIRNERMLILSASRRRLLVYVAQRIRTGAMAEYFACMIPFHYTITSEIGFRSTRTPYICSAHLSIQDLSHPRRH